MKRIVVVLLTCGLLCGGVTGCGKLLDRMADEDDFATLGYEVYAESKGENTFIGISLKNEQNLGEDYVYDYQVSMQPIPKKIAELGGPCQGTIHAFPSRIKMGLTQKMIEEDPELKLEIEKRIPEVEQALVENIGGEFKIDGVNALSTFDWVWYCTEVSTGHQFSVTYINNEYDDKKNGRDNWLHNEMFLEGYYETEKTAKIVPEIEPLIFDIFEGSLYKIQIQGSTDDVDIYIIQFTDGAVDKSGEQVKILQLWEKLQEYDNDRDYNLFLIYFPTIYMETIKQKYENGYLSDMRLGGEESVRVLLEAGEIKDVFVYEPFWNQHINTSLGLLERYKKEERNLNNAIEEHWLTID